MAEPRASRDRCRNRFQQAVAGSQHHSAAGGEHACIPRSLPPKKPNTFTMSRRGLGGTATACQCPEVLIYTWIFLTPATEFRSRVFGATYRHWGHGHQLHAHLRLPSAHRVTKGTQPTKCHLSAGGCGVPVSGHRGGVWLVLPGRAGLEFPAAHTSTPLPATTVLALVQSSPASLHDLALASIEDHLRLALPHSCTLNSWRSAYLCL